MHTIEETESPTNIIALPQDFDINSAELFQEKAIKSIAQNKPIVVDMSELDAIDTCGCQWLIWLIQLCHLKHVSIELDDAPAPLQEALTLLGLEEKYNEIGNLE